jgi:hypothetical protein
MHSTAVHRPFAGCNVRPHPDHVLHGLPGGGCRSHPDHAIAGYPEVTYCTHCYTPTLRGLQCEATPGPRIVRATRRQVQLHPDHAAAGYPEAESPDHTPLSTPATHRPFAGCNAKRLPDHVLHGLPGSRCQGGELPDDGQPHPDHAFAGYPEAATHGPADASRQRRGYPYAVCDSCTHCYTPTLMGSSVQPHPDHAYAGYPEADAGPTRTTLSGLPGYDRL